MTIRPRVTVPLWVVLGFLAFAILAAAIPASGGHGGTALAAADTRPAAAQRYVCPPCGSPCDTLSFAGPGVCPGCGMKLVEAGSEAARPRDHKKVAVLVFSGCEIIDFAGPYEMFGAADCDVYTVAATRDPVTTAMGLTVLPKFTFGDAPRPDVLVIPGGSIGSAVQDAATLRYIQDVTAHVTHTMSVCNGAFILANTGLLDGRSATTTYHNLTKLAKQYPKIKVVEDQRYVDNGKIITTGGLSAGMDGALHVIAKLFGTGTAQQVALGEEYDWKPGGGTARATLADHQIPEVQLDDLGDWTVVRTEGDTNHWNIVVSGQSKLAAADLMGRLETALSGTKWKKLDSRSPASAARTSHWRFNGTDGKPWTGTLSVDPGSGHDGVTAGIAVARVN